MVGGQENSLLSLSQNELIIRDSVTQIPLTVPRKRGAEIFQKGNLLHKQMRRTVNIDVSDKYDSESNSSLQYAVTLIPTNGGNKKPEIGEPSKMRLMYYNKGAKQRVTRSTATEVLRVTEIFDSVLFAHLDTCVVHIIITLQLVWNVLHLQSRVFAVN